MTWIITRITIIIRIVPRIIIKWTPIIGRHPTPIAIIVVIIKWHTIPRIPRPAPTHIVVIIIIIWVVIHIRIVTRNIDTIITNRDIIVAIS